MLSMCGTSNKERSTSPFNERFTTFTSVSSDDFTVLKTKHVTSETVSGAARNLPTIYLEDDDYWSSDGEVEFQDNSSVVRNRYRKNTDARKSLSRCSSTECFTPRKRLELSPLHCHTLEGKHMRIEPGKYPNACLKHESLFVNGLLLHKSEPDYGYLGPEHFVSIEEVWHYYYKYTADSLSYIHDIETYFDHLTSEDCIAPTGFTYSARENWPNGKAPIPHLNFFSHSHMKVVFGEFDEKFKRKYPNVLSPFCHEFLVQVDKFYLKRQLHTHSISESTTQVDKQSTLKSCLKFTKNLFLNTVHRSFLVISTLLHIFCLVVSKTLNYTVQISKICTNIVFLGLKSLQNNFCGFVSETYSTLLRTAEFIRVPTSLITATTYCFSSGLCFLYQVLVSITNTMFLGLKSLQNNCCGFVSETYSTLLRTAEFIRVPTSLITATTHCFSSGLSFLYQVLVSILWIPFKLVYILVYLVPHALLTKGFKVFKALMLNSIVSLQSNLDYMKSKVFRKSNVHTNSNGNHSLNQITQLMEHQNSLNEAFDDSSANLKSSYVKQRSKDSRRRWCLCLLPLLLLLTFLFFPVIKKDQNNIIIAESCPETPNMITVDCSTCYKEFDYKINTIKEEIEAKFKQLSEMNVVNTQEKIQENRKEIYDQISQKQAAIAISIKEYDVKMADRIYQLETEVAGIKLSISNMIKNEVSAQLIANKNEEKITDEVKDQIISLVTLEVLKRMSTSNAINHHESFSLIKQDVERLILLAISLYDADKTGKPDFALETSGGSVHSIRCTETYTKASPNLLFLGYDLWPLPSLPSKVIQPSVNPGDCWAFVGSSGQIILKLSHPIHITGITLEHIPKSLAPNGKIDTAPKDFIASAQEQGDDSRGIPIGIFAYQESGTPLQYFTAEDTSQKFQFVKVEFVTNWGHPEYTCVYRIRVHGNP